uniref:Small ribosomal subunit protein uS15 N-terminal domain-containing protein n=1 Tax=Peromyscus maniculatus bairdii TaxID=230844 RepID=A0A8C8UN49_PERMB
MGGMHAPGKGLSQSALSYPHSVPTWLKLTSDDVKEQIYKLAKKGLTPSQIATCDCLPLQILRPKGQRSCLCPALSLSVFSLYRPPDLYG